MLTHPELIPLAHSSAESLKQARDNGLQQWGYPAIQRQIQGLQSDLLQHVDTLAGSQSGSAESLGQYVGQLAQHLDQLTRNQTSSVASLVENMATLSQHLDQLTRNQTSSVASLVENTAALSQRLDHVASSHADSAGSLGQYVGQLAQHLDQLTRNQLLSIDMQRSADAHWQASEISHAGLGDDLRARLSVSEGKAEEIRLMQLQLSEKLDNLAKQGLVPRIKRLLGR